MSMTLGDVITDIRLRSPFYGSDTIPNRVLGHALSSAQKRLALEATQRNSAYLSQVFSIAFALADANTVGQAGVSTAGGLPGTVDASGTFEVAERNIGIAPVYDLAQGTTLVTPTPVSSATSSTVTPIGVPGWTVDQFVGDLVVVRDGVGAPQIQTILSNTSDTLTIDGEWSITPTTASQVEVLTNVPLSATELGVVTNLPAFGQVTGYLVRLDASGNPTLDLTQPVVTSIQQGIPLPPFDRILGASVLWTGATTAEGAQAPSALGTMLQEVPVFSYADALRHPYRLGVYVLGNELYFTGASSGWVGAQNLDLRYVPIPPEFGATATALEEFFLLPDTARDALESCGAVAAAEYARAKGLNADVEGAKQERDFAVASWLKSVGQQQGRAQRTTRRNR